MKKMYNMHALACSSVFFVKMHARACVDSISKQCKSKLNTFIYRENFDYQFINISH